MYTMTEYQDNLRKRTKALLIGILIYGAIFLFHVIGTVFLNLNWTLPLFDSVTVVFHLFVIYTCVANAVEYWKDSKRSEAESKRMQAYLKGTEYDSASTFQFETSRKKIALMYAGVILFGLLMIFLVLDDYIL